MPHDTAPPPRAAARPLAERVARLREGDRADFVPGEGETPRALRHRICKIALRLIGKGRFRTSIAGGRVTLACIDEPPVAPPGAADGEAFYLTAERAAEWLSALLAPEAITAEQLRIRTKRGDGPAGARIKPVVLYAPRDLQAWAASRARARRKEGALHRSNRR